MAGRAPRSDSLPGPSASSQGKPVEKLPDNPAAAQSGVVGRSMTSVILHDALAHSVRDKLEGMHSSNHATSDNRPPTGLRLIHSGEI